MTQEMISKQVIKAEQRSQKSISSGKQSQLKSIGSDPIIECPDEENSGNQGSSLGPQIITDGSQENHPKGTLESECSGENTVGGGSNNSIINRAICLINEGENGDNYEIEKILTGK